MISHTMPIAGRISTYTSGWARNQNRCCHSNGLPPPLMCASCPPTARPVGRKKLVCATLSINCMTPAASSGGNASSSRKAVTNCAQTKNGSRIHVMPGARNWMIVAMKFTAPSSDEVIRNTMPISQNVWPSRRDRGGQRRIGRPARLRRAARNEEADQHDDAADHVGLVAGHVHARKRHVRRADLQRHHVIAERGERQRHDGQEHHDRPVHRAEGIVEVRPTSLPPAAAVVCPKQLLQQAAHHRNRLARMRNLPAHHQHQAEAEQQEAQRRQAVLDADDLVIGGENVFAPEARLFVMGFVDADVRHRVCRRLHVSVSIRIPPR